MQFTWFRARIIATITAFSLTACGTPQPLTDTQRVVDQMRLGLIWSQQTGEFHALAYQAFNAAKVSFDHSKTIKGKKKAVISDLDETLLDNSAYQAWRLNQLVPATSESWNRWVKSGQTTAIPGAVEFANYVNSHGGTMFYVSNRTDEDLKAFTIKDMQRLGFTGANDKTVILGHGAKGARFADIEKMGYDIVMYVGDNLNDFGDSMYKKSNTERRQFAAQNEKQFGTKYIVLPSPIYGDWEHYLTPDYRQQPDSEKLKIRANSLDAWDGR